MSELRELYQEVILDHNRHPHNFGALEGADCHADGFNPLCGDKLTVYVNLQGQTITDVCFLGSGCAISKASASLMTDAVRGKTLTDVRGLFDRFLLLVTDGATDDANLGKLAVLGGVRDYPTRVKCASLAWHTLRAAIDNRDDVVTTE